MGVSTTSATQPGVIAGIGVSLVAMIAVKVLTPLAWTWYVVTGTIICVSVGMIVSFITRPAIVRAHVRNDK